MRVCDVTKSEPVQSRYVIYEVPLDAQALFAADGSANEGVREVHDIEVGESAATAIEAKRWGDLHKLTPASERPKDESRSEAAKKAGVTRKANREAAAKTEGDSDAKVAGE